MSTFICYSRADSAFAVRLAQDLKSAGYDAWLDQLDIPTGARWDDEIENALEACTTFIIVLSPDSIYSQNVKDEVGYAIDAGKDILPLMIKSGDIPFRLRRFQYVDFTDKPYEASLKEIKSILSATGHLLEAQDSEKYSSGAPTRPAMSTPFAQGKKLAAREAAGTNLPMANTRGLRRGLIFGMVGVAALVVGGIIINAMGNRNPPEAPTSTSAPIVESLPTAQPTASPTLDATQVAALTQTESPQFFTTNFSENTDLDNWEHFVLGEGRKNKANISQSGDGLVFNLDDPDLHAYYMYPVIYKDIIVRMKVENLGQNKNHIGLICRRTGNTWYELSISSDQLWHLYDYRGEYLPITNGGSQAIKFGKSINEYEMLCIGDEISIRINGQLEKTVDISPYKNHYAQGQVGFGVSSIAVYPIDIRVLEFQVSEP